MNFDTTTSWSQTPTNSGVAFVKICAHDEHSQEYSDDKTARIVIVLVVFLCHYALNTEDVEGLL